ncbi:hypothetical protein V3C99_008665 [Haemonchus contortus]
MCKGKAERDWRWILRKQETWFCNDELHRDVRRKKVVCKPWQKTRAPKELAFYVRTAVQTTKEHRVAQDIEVIRAVMASDLAVLKKADEFRRTPKVPFDRLLNKEFHSENISTGETTANHIGF